MLYKVLTYERGTDGPASVHEVGSWEEVDDLIDTCKNDLRANNISAFYVSMVSDKVYTKPFWEDED